MFDCVEAASLDCVQLQAALQNATRYNAIQANFLPIPPLAMCNFDANIFDKCPSLLQFPGLNGDQLRSLAFAALRVSARYLFVEDMW